MFDQSQVQELLDAAKPAVIESLKRELTQTITWDVKNEASRIVKDAVVAWVTENIVPEIMKQLIESKEGLVALGAQLAPAMVDSLVASMSATIAEKLKNSWDRKKVFEAILS